MDTLRPHGFIFVRCAGCGNSRMVAFDREVYVMSAPEISCSDECLRRYEVSMEAFLERQSNS